MKTKDLYFLTVKSRSDKLTAFTDIKLERPELIRGQFKGYHFPLTFEVLGSERGSIFYDLIATPLRHLYLISEAFKKVLESDQLAGWTTYPITLVKGSKPVEGYHGFSVTGKCGPVTYDQCEVVHKSCVPQGPICRFYRGFCLDVDTSKPDDFFFPSAEIGIVVTDRAMRSLTRVPLTNVAFKSIVEQETLASDVHWLDFLTKHPNPTQKEIERFRQYLKAEKKF